MPPEIGSSGGGYGVRRSTVGAEDVGARGRPSTKIALSQFIGLADSKHGQVTTEQICLILSKPDHTSDRDKPAPPRIRLLQTGEVIAAIRIRLNK